MNFTKCKITFLDGTTLEPIINGNNFGFSTKQPESLFVADNMSVLKIKIDGMAEMEYHDILFVQQSCLDGVWYVSLRQKAKSEKNDERMEHLEDENAELKDMIAKLSEV